MAYDTRRSEVTRGQATINIAEAAGNAASVTVTADQGTAVCVLLETSGGQEWAGKFSENAFTLLPGESKTVTFTARFVVDVAMQMKNFTQFLKVRSLVDAFYYPKEEMTSLIV